ncbi:MAG TPA: enoyl-CoA hydratase-related protein [Gemmatimonadales bacterium]|nr:enoyl-CoA hydratase-related protein [Gemmatimonadales bacterium]
MPTVLLSYEGPVGVITIARRERFNAMDVTTAREFRAAGLRMARDAAVRCVVIRGDGGVFCSGADLKYVRERGDPADFGYLQPEGVGPGQGYGESFKQILEYLHSAISEIRRAPKPFIAAVDGIAAAGGFGLAMACDLVVASERAAFEWAYHKTGLSGAESSTFLLPRLLGWHKAMELVLLNPRLSAVEARDLGLVARVFPVASFESETLALATQLAEGPTGAYAIAKRLLNQAAGMERLDAHLDQELQQLTLSADSPEFAEGLAAFFERRTPQFPALTPEATR